VGAMKKEEIMKLCFPVVKDEGWESEIYGHFASAPLFVIVDTDTRKSSAVANCDQASPYAGCNPFSALKGQELSGIVVGGIGDESLRVMNLCGFKVYQAQSAAVSENIARFTEGGLEELAVQQSHLEGRCSGGEGAHQCSHHH
jgi:predicted Fe-Mo cluster-binding NifX family protein